MRTEALLLAGKPVDAEAEALAHPSPTARIGLVRARVQLARPADAAAALEGIARDSPEERAAHALVALASGEPGRARAILIDPGDGALWTSLVRAEVTRASGDLGTALQVAGRAREAAEHTGEPRWVARAELQLARCLGDAGDFGLARELATRAHLAFEQHTPHTVLEAEALDVGGALARKDDNALAAVAMHERARAIWEAAVGVDSALVAGCRYSLAHALHRSGDFARALTEMQAAFLTTQKVFGPDHLDTWITRFELGRMEVDNGEMIDGFPRMTAARAEVARRLGAQHPVVRAMDRFL